MRTTSDADAFWSMYAQLFDNQTAIAPENIHEKLLDFAKLAKSINFQQFQNCLNNQMSLGLVLRDMNLASDNNINATPTLFINGQRLLGIRDAAQLRQLIAGAQKLTSGKMNAAILPVSANGSR